MFLRRELDVHDAAASWGCAKARLRAIYAALRQVGPRPIRRGCRHLDSTWCCPRPAVAHTCQAGAQGGRVAKILIIGHGYNEPERMKLLEGIGSEHELTYLTPPGLWSIAIGDAHVPESTPRVTVVPAKAIRPGGRCVFAPSFKVLSGPRPDIIHVEYDPWTPEFWSAYLSTRLRWRGVPLLIYSKKNTRPPLSGTRGRIREFLTRQGLKRVQMVLVASEMCRDIFLKLGVPKKAIQIQGYIPIDTDIFSPSLRPAHSSPFKVTFVGSIAHHKGVDVLLAAVEQLRENGSHQIEVDLVGPIRDSAIAAWEDEPWIRSWGLLPNREVAAVLATANAFVMPSRVLPDHEEHDGQALLEAMASGIPCIGTRSGCIPELIVHEVTGILVAPDDADDLAAAIERLVTDPELRVRLSAAALPAALQRTGLDALRSQRNSVYERMLHG